MDQIKIMITLKNTMGPNGGTMRLRHADCTAKATCEDGTEVRIGGTVGGGLEISVAGKTFYASAKDIWNAAADQFNLEKAN